MPMVRESKVTFRCFCSALNVPTGVAKPGLPIDAGISRTTCSSILTVNVCADRSATPTTAAPDSKLVDAPPAVTLIWLWAGQNPSGIHCTTSSFSHANRPVTFLEEVTAIVRSAAGRSAIGSENLTTTGCATPTTSPRAGSIIAAVKVADGDETAARPGLPEPATAIAAVPVTTSTYRTALRTVSIPSRWRDQFGSILIRQDRPA